MEQKNYLIYGISKGLGKAIIEYIPQKNDVVFGISRTEPANIKQYPNFKWIASDLSNSQTSVVEVCNVIKNQKIDYLIYNVGIWEQYAFSNEYDFLQNSSQEILNIINTNIASCILHIQALIANLKLSDNAKIILIGSTWGLENHNGKEVVFSASKFALRGIVHALRENLREFNIGVSVLNLGYLATEYGCDISVEDIIKISNGDLIPLQDVLAAIRFILSTSKATCVKEINMPAMKDMNV